MPTTKQRINITADIDMEKALRNVARRDRVSVASKAVELIRIALEIEEDYILAGMVMKRDTKDIKFISHDSLWNKILEK